MKSSRLIVLGSALVVMIALVAFLLLWQTGSHASDPVAFPEETEGQEVEDGEAVEEIEKNVKQSDKYAKIQNLPKLDEADEEIRDDEYSSDEVPSSKEENFHNTAAKNNSTGKESSFKEQNNQKQHDSKIPGNQSDDEEKNVKSPNKPEKGGNSNSNQEVVLNTLGEGYEIQDNRLFDQWGVIIKLDRLPDALQNRESYVVTIGTESYPLEENMYDSNVFNTQVSSFAHTKEDIEESILTVK